MGMFTWTVEDAIIENNKMEKTIDTLREELKVTKEANKNAMAGYRRLKGENAKLLTKAKKLDRIQAQVFLLYLFLKTNNYIPDAKVRATMCDIIDILNEDNTDLIYVDTDSIHSEV